MGEVRRSDVLGGKHMWCGEGGKEGEFRNGV